MGKSYKHPFKGFYGFVISAWMLVTIISCSKDEGFGGKASISGQILTHAYNEDLSILQQTYPAEDMEVYIQFGNSNTYGDRIRSNYEGRFRFDYLTPGNYTIYYYGDNTSKTLPGTEAYQVEVNIDKSDRNIDLGVLEHIEILDFDNGKASISGRIFNINYNRDFTVLRDTSFSFDEPVLLVYNNQPGVDDRIRTSYDGTFIFKNLIKGEYKISAVTDTPEGQIPFVIEVDITELDQEVILDDIYLTKN